MNSVNHELGKDISPRKNPGVSQPLVSVIIDNYNYARFLKTAIESVFAQTYQNFELIIVDDGSTDHSREVIDACCAIEGYRDRIIPIFQENSGQGGACSTGFVHAKGDFVCFLDADDYYHPQKLEKVVDAFQTHPAWIQVAHGWILVDADGHPKGRNTSNILSQGNMKPLLLKWGKFASGITSALAYRRLALANVMPAPNRCIIDSYLNASVPFYGDIGCINETLMYYRTHGKNTQAYNDDVDYLIKERREIASFINQAARQNGVPQHFDLKNDVDFQAYSVIQKGYASWKERLHVIKLSIQESIELRRSPRDSFIRFCFRSIFVFFPREAPTLLKLGLRRYLWQKIATSK